MKQQLSPEQMEWFRQQALNFAQRAVPAESPAPVQPDAPAQSDPAKSQAEYQLFLQKHPAKGTLKVQVSTARGALPVEQASITVAKRFSDETRTLYEGVTDESGILENILLPALPAAYSQSPDTAATSGTDYQVSVFHPTFREQENMTATIFDQIQTILPVSMYPKLK